MYSHRKNILKLFKILLKCIASKSSVFLFFKKRKIQVIWWWIQFALSSLLSHVSKGVIFEAHLCSDIKIQVGWSRQVCYSDLVWNTGRNRRLSQLYYTFLSPEIALKSITFLLNSKSLFQQYCILPPKSETGRLNVNHKALFLNKSIG